MHLCVCAFGPGTIDPDVRQLPYRFLNQPAYPLGSEMTWQPTA